MWHHALCQWTLLPPPPPSGSTLKLETSMFHCNGGNFISDETASHLTKLQSSYTLLWETSHQQNFLYDYILLSPPPLLFSLSFLLFFFIFYFYFIFLFFFIFFFFLSFFLYFPLVDIKISVYSEYVLPLAHDVGMLWETHSRYVSVRELLLLLINFHFSLTFYLYWHNCYISWSLAGL